MKKLLSLLSVLTISGNAVPTTIAASSYQKENNNEISYDNYQQTNNLENLNRIKRDLGSAALKVGGTSALGFVWGSTAGPIVGIATVVGTAIVVGGYCLVKQTC